MIRELFHIGSFSVSPFGVMLMIAFIASWLQLRWALPRLGAGNDEDASAIVFAAGFGGIVGAKVYYALLYRDWSLLLDRAGLVWYGGFILGALAVLWTMRRRRLPTWEVADAGALALALGYALGRLGCFLVGDDYGLPTTAPWGVAFPVGQPPTTAGALRRVFGIEVPAGVPDGELLAVHPTQLYETASCLLIWAAGLWLLSRRPRPGTVALAVLALLAAERFVVEFFRAKDDRFFGVLTLAQVLSVALAVIVLWLWAARPRQPRPGPADAGGAAARRAG